MLILPQLRLIAIIIILPLIHRKNTLADMAIACGGTVFGTEGSDLKLEKASMSDLGEVEEVTITKDDTLMLRGKGIQAEIDQRMEFIQDQIEDTKSEYEKEKVSGL